MPTIKDIAKEAGVSHGTASNVLNGKGNVSLKKIQLVEDAARKLGYKMNYTAKSLRSGGSNSVSVILPNIESDEYIQLYKGLEHTLNTQGYRPHLYLTYDLPHNETNIIKEIAAEGVTGIVTISCLDTANVYYKTIDIPREHIIFVNRDIPHVEQLVSFDFKEAGAEISAYIQAKSYRSVGIFADDLSFSCEKLFADAIVNSLQGIDIQVLHAPFNQAYRKSFAFFEQEPPEIIITSSLNKAYLLKNAHFWGAMKKPPHIVSLGATPSTYMDSFTVYHQNYHLLGHKIARFLVQQGTDDRMHANTMMIENSGIPNWEHVVQQTDQKTLRMLTIPSPTTDALLKLVPHFTKMTGIKLQLTVKSYEDMYQILSGQPNVHQYDLIRIDMAWLSWFGKDLFLPLTGLDSDLDRLIDSYSPQVRATYSLIDGTPYAIPFDPSIQMLFYRKDLFEDPKVKRMYYETYKKQLSIPTDFDAYNELVRFFSAAHSRYSPTQYGTSVTVGRPEIIAAEFLTRYYAANGTLVDDDGVRLQTEIATKALQNYLETVRDAQILHETWLEEAVNSFARGETAMVIGFMNHVSRIASSDIGTCIGSSSVPGNKPLLGGGVIGMSKHTVNTHEAVCFLHWVNQLEVAEQISLLGGTSANPNVCSNQTINTLYPWIYEALQMNENGVRDTKFLNGLGFNTKQLEQIIGLAIEGLLHEQTDIRPIIDQINDKLHSFSQME